MQCNNGVVLYGLWGNDYNERVPWNKSLVAEKEMYIKQELKGFIKQLDRGSERVSIKKVTLKELVALVNNSKFRSKDPEKETNELENLRYNKEKQESALSGEDRIVEIIQNRVRQGNTEFRAKWSRKYSDNEDATTWELPEFIKSVRGGTRLLNTYLKEHPWVTIKRNTR